MMSTLILDRLDRYWASIGHVHIATTSKQIWLDMGVDDAALGGRFGWCWPGPYQDPADPSAQILVAYCPEILAEILAHLSDEDRSEYLNAVEYLCSRFIGSIERADDPGFRDELFAELAENFPSTAQLLDEVEERAIRLGLVPAEPGGDVTQPDVVCTACGYFTPKGADLCGLCGGAL